MWRLETYEIENDTYKPDKINEKGNVEKLEKTVREVE